MPTGLWKLITLCIASVALVGCASNPRFAMNRLPGQACIDADSNRSNANFSMTQAVVTISEIDGKKAGSDSPFCLSAGKHHFKVEAFTDFRKTAGFTELELSADTSFWLRGKLRDGSLANKFDFQLYSVTSDVKKMIAEFSLDAVPRRLDFFFIPGQVPIVIPKEN